MLLLTSTSDIVRVITGGAADIEVYAAYMDNASGTITPGRTVTPSITTATTTTVVGSPAASTQRNVKHLNITNNHASASSTVSVEIFDGTNAAELMQVTLLAGENLVLDAEGGWHHHDVQGGDYPATGARASQAEMEAGTATDKSVTPQGVNWHPGACKCWVKAGVTGNILGSWNVTSLTDTGAGLMAVTIATDFSSTNYVCLVSTERASTALAVTNLNFCNVRNATPAVGSVTVEAYDGTVTTAVQEDPTSWHVAMFGDQ